jgi:2-(1,2-epoxy-1,2-dihydrophenyl)acetyl-CoA isomerase
MPGEPVIYEARDGVAVITLNRPESLNAFTPAMLGALHEALARAAGEGQRAILLTGTGRGFSSGMDLESVKADYDSGAPDFLGLMHNHFHPVVRMLRAIEMPTVAGINGTAAGAGFSMALACDIRIAAEGARFATAFTRIGLVPDCGMAYTLPHLAGAGRASAMLMLAEPFDAQAALQWGVVDRVVPADGFAEAAFDLARRLAAGPTRAYVLTRRLLDTALTGSLEDTLEAEARLQAEAGSTEDHRNAVAAFLKKEQAVFTGR